MILDTGYWMPDRSQVSGFRNEYKKELNEWESRAGLSSIVFLADYDSLIPASMEAGPADPMF